MDTHYKAGDKIKYFEDNYCTFPRYGTIVRVNKKTITINLEGSAKNIRVDVSTLNYD